MWEFGVFLYAVVIVMGTGGDDGGRLGLGREGGGFTASETEGRRGVCLGIFRVC